MASTTVKRCLGIAGLTGGLMLVGVGASMAAEPSHDGGTHDTTSHADGAAGASAPISVGGLHLGLSSSSSHASGSSSTTTHDDGSSSTTSHQQATKRSSDLGLDVGKVTVDPSAVVKGATSSARSDHGRDDTSSRASTGGAKAAAPVHVGGVQVTGSTHEEKATKDERSSTDRDGSTSSSGHSSTSSRTTSGGVGVGSTSVDPTAAVAGSSAGSDRADRADGHRARTRSSDDTSKASGAAGLSSPVHLGGLTATGSHESSSTDSQWSSWTDKNGDGRYTRTDSSDSSAAQGGIATGAVDADPAAVLTGSSDRKGASDEARSAGTSRASGALRVTAPVRSGGAQAWGSEARTSRDVRTDDVRQDGVTRTSQHGTSDASHAGGALGIGALAVDPTLSGRGAATSAQDGDRGYRTEVGSSASGKDGALDLAAPFRFDGLDAAGTFGRDSSRWDRGAVTDDRGTSSTTTWSTDSSEQDPSVGTGPVQGDLAGWAWDEITGASTSRR